MVVVWGEVLNKIKKSSIKTQKYLKGATVSAVLRVEASHAQGLALTGGQHCTGPEATESTCFLAPYSLG